MMRFKTLAICCCLCSLPILQAKDSENPISPAPYDKDANNRFFEIKAGYFTPWSKTFTQMYAGGLDLQVAYTQPIVDYFSLYVDGEFYYLSGHALGDSSRSTLQMYAISAGLKGVSPNIYKNAVKFYMIAGPRYLFAYQTNNSTFVEKHLNSNNFAGFAAAGFLVEPKQHLVLDFWLDASYCEMTFHPTQVNTYSAGPIQMGGLGAGLGIGYSF